MMHTIRLKRHGYGVALCALALLLALIAWPAAVSAQAPGGPPGGPGNGEQGPGNNPGDGPGGNPGETPGENPDQPGTPSTGPGGTPGGGGTTPTTPDPVKISDPAFSDNRVVQHAATPAQLIKAGEGLHYYFIGADGSAATGPYITSFASLAEMYPTGGAVSLFSGANPLTGKSVNIYYLADQMKIQVNTFYPASHDQYNPHKAYNFTVDSSYTVNHLAW